MRYIETTINIKKNILDNIAQTSKVLGKSQTEIIVMLLKKVIDNENSKVQICRRIKYQSCDDKNNWHTLHVLFEQNEYEYFLDLRKLLKMSLSFIIANAAKKYLKDLLNGNFTDNNRYQNYILSRENADGIIYWVLFWGIPKNLKKYITFVDH
ncbi:hypothetical protein ACFL20_01135 [Spirochaetota bacterium]